jgi:hypothetical protein
VGKAKCKVCRFDAQEFKRQIESLDSSCRVLVPQIFQTYSLEDEM